MERRLDLITPEGQCQVWLERIPQRQTAIAPTTGNDQIPVEEHIHRIDLVQRITTLENKTKRLESLFGLSTVPMNTLGNSKWELKQPLDVAIEQRGAEDFVACLYDVDLYGYGDTVPEALNDVKTAIMSQFEYLTRQDRKIQLGESLKRQLQFLRNILVKTGA